MKKILYLILILFSLVSLAACNEKEDNTTNNQDESPIDLSGVVFEGIEVVYDGEEHSIYAYNLPNGVSVSYVGNGVKEVGTHTVVAKLYDGDNILLKELTATITVINAKDADLPLV